MTGIIKKTGYSEKIAVITQGHIHIPDNPPELILVVGPCRTGTTALGNVFARLGVVSYMQPIKSIRRAVEERQPIPEWTIDPLSPIIFSKETLGAKTEAEFFDPVEVLQSTGYPLSKIHVVGTCRDPRATLGSWVEMWGKVPMAGFIDSFRLIDRILERSEQYGARVTHYVQEAIGTNEPRLVIERLLGRVGFSGRQGLSMAADWKAGPTFGDKDSNIVLFDSPPERFVRGVKEGDSYHFRLLVARLTAGQDRELISSGVYDIFEKFASKCEKELGIDILEK